MAAPTTPPDEQPFRFVLEHPQRGLDPRNPVRFQLYEEPARNTRNIRLGGRHRALMFVNRPNSRLALFKRGWKDRTEQFGREWEKRDGAWVHTEPAPTPAPITQPDAAPPPPDDGPLDQPAKTFSKRCRDGQYDDALDELLAQEKSAKRSRGGVIAAIMARKSALSQAAGS